MDTIEFYAQKGLSFYKERVSKGEKKFLSLIEAEKEMLKIFTSEIKEAYSNAKEGIIDSIAYIRQTRDSELYNKITKELFNVADIVSSSWFRLKEKLISAYYLEILYYELNEDK